MATWNIRGVPRDVDEVLRREAEQRRQSVTSIVIGVLREYAERVKRRERLAGVREELDRLRRTIARRRRRTSDSARLLREDRAR